MTKTALNSLERRATAMRKQRPAWVDSLERRAAAMRERQENQRPPRVVVDRAVRLVVGHAADAAKCSERERRALTWLWSSRACFVCGCLGKCAHREPAIDLAELAAKAR